MSISPVLDIVADLRAGRMVILVDEEDRENEGDLVLASDHVTADAINFMARFGRDAARYVNSDAGKALNLRGINAKVVQPGKVVSGSRISKLDA